MIPRGLIISRAGFPKEPQASTLGILGIDRQAQQNAANRRCCMMFSHTCVAAVKAAWTLFAMHVIVPYQHAI
ncbi:hypothetical protein SAMN02799622_05742 [Methylobacterium sp. UNC378MF]|nr:hypothetical protein SAMN02799622_05742 [Methylobacterium sp. UNC378MF]